MKGRLYLPLALVFCGAWALFSHRAELRHPELYYGDTGYYYVLRGYADGARLGKDHLMSYLRQNESGRVSMIPAALLPIERRLAARFGPRDILLWKSILLQFAVCALAALALRRRYGEDAAWALPLFALYFSMTDVFFGGLHRGFGAAALLLLYLALLTGSAWLWAAALGAYAAFYHASLPMAAAVWACWRWRGRILSSPARAAAYAALYAAALLTGAQLAKALFPGTVEGVLYAFSWKDLEAGGVGGFIRNYVINSPEFNHVYAWVTVALAAAALAGAQAGRKLLDAAELPLALGLLAAFTGLALFSPALASRQTVHALPLLLLLAFCGLLSGLRIKELGWAAAAALLAVFLVKESEIADLHRADPRVNSAIEAAAGQDDMLFAHPLRKELSLYTGRASYFWLEADSFICASGSARECGAAVERLHSALAAYYSESGPGLAAFIRSSGADHYLVDERYYSREFFTGEGGERRLRALSARYAAGAARPALLEAARAAGKEVAEGVYLAPAGRLLEAAERL